MSKIIIFVLANLISIGIAQQDISAAICATPGDYDGSHEYASGGTKMTCDQIAAHFGLSCSGYSF